MIIDSANFKKILYVADAKSIHTQRWAEHYRNNGVEVHIASFRAAELPGINVHLLPTAYLGRLGYFIAVPYLRYIYKKINPDVTHAHYITSYGAVAALAGINPVVLTAWGTDVLISPKKSKIHRWLASYAVKHANAVTTVAEHMNQAVADLGVPRNNISAVPFGVDTQLFRPAINNKIPGKFVRVISTRNFLPIYNIETIICAVEKCILRGLQIQVDLVGDGPLRDELEKKVEVAGLSRCVKFYGHVDHKQLSSLLADADIFISSAISDGNNISLNEAMACSCYPIATAIPANMQWIEHGVNGLLYPTGDKEALANCIERAANDDLSRQKAGLLNRKIVEQRADWRICVARMNETYEAVIAKIRD